MMTSKPSNPLQLVIFLAAMAGLGCGPGSSDDPASREVVATFAGGQVLRGELLEHEASQEATPDSGDATGAAKDWRIATIHDMALQKALAAEAPDNPTLLARIAADQEEILVSFMKRDLGWNQLTVTEAEIRHQFDTHPEQYTDPEMIRVQHIFLRSEITVDDPATRIETRQRLEAIRRELLDGADFTALARQHSESATTHRGGWLGVKKGEDVDPAFAEAAWSLEPNEISEVIDTPNGFHVIVFRERRPGLIREYEDVREFARRRTLTDKLAQVQRSYTDEIGRKYGLEADFDILSDPFVPMEAALFTIDGEPFTVQQLIDELPGQVLENLNNGYMRDVIDYLDRAVADQLLVREAAAINLHNRPEVERKLETINRQIRTQYVLDQRLAERVAQIPDSELRSYFDQNNERYQSVRRTDLSLIYLPPGDNLWSTFKFAEELAGQIRNGGDFAELARAHSRHYSARNGGAIKGLSDHAIATRVQAPAKFRKTLGSLEDGEVAQPMVAESYDPKSLKYVPTGVLVFRRDKVDLPVAATYEDAKILVQSNYLRRNYQRLKSEFESDFFDEIDLRIVEENLPSL